MRYRSILVCMILASAAHAADLPAFPGAEGFGAVASGGRGGSVYEVINLDDSGPGSLRDAVSQGNRTIIFRISGTIDLKSRLTIGKPNITIAGQTAPGDGICLRGHELFIKDTSNVIVRFIRIRPGDESKSELDAVTIWNAGDVILDHCSLSWSTDSLNDVVKESGNVTVQWCILSEPLNNSVHVKGAHGYGTGWDGRTKGGGSFHHNLIAHAASRAPRLGYHKVGRGLIDCRNNVIYNCGPSYGGETDDFNFVGNYYRPGPKDFRPDHVLFHISDHTGRGFFEGNIYEGRPSIAADNTSAVTVKPPMSMFVPVPDGAPHSPPSTQPAALSDARGTCIVTKAFEVAPVQTEPADIAYERVLREAGAILPQRDPVDQRIVSEVRERTGKLINSQKEVGGWPELKSATPPKDTDHDGMPDQWEMKQGLNPNDELDGRAFSKTGYTNLETYLNELAVVAAQSK